MCAPSITGTKWPGSVGIVSGASPILRATANAVRMVSRNHHDADPGPPAFFDRVRYFAVWRVHHGDESEKRRSLFYRVGL